MPGIRGIVRDRLRFFCCLLAILLFAVSKQSSSSTDFSMEVLEWQAKGIVGGVLELTNPFGDLRCRSVDGDQAQISVAVQRFSDETDAFRINAEQTDKRISVRLVQPLDQARGKGRADVTLLLPKGMDAELNTRDGVIRVERFSARVRARSQTGSISFSGDQPFDLFSDRGDIKVLYNARDWHGLSRTRTNAGSIRLTLTSDARGLLLAEANAVEWPADLAPGVQRGGDQVNDSIGRLELYAPAGDIRIGQRDWPRPGKANQTKAAPAERLKPG